MAEQRWKSGVLFNCPGNKPWRLQELGKGKIPLELKLAELDFEREEVPSQQREQRAHLEGWGGASCLGPGEVRSTGGVGHGDSVTSWGSLEGVICKQ